MSHPAKGVTVVSTLLNEEQALPEFLDSLLAQTRTPEEIILVDGGSSDASCEIIRRRIEDGAPIQLVVLEGANRARGRNEGISRATQGVIAVTDVGCRLEPDWLEKIVAPIERGDADVAAGYYAPLAETTLERAVAAATVQRPDEVRPASFMPSSRSVAFTISAWEDVGGYPEWTTEGEDTLFDSQLRDAGKRFVFVPEAIVHWRQQSSFGAVYRQFYAYAKSDGALGQTFGHYRKTFFLTGLFRGMLTVIALLLGLSVFVPLLAATQSISHEMAIQILLVIQRSNALVVVVALLVCTVVAYCVRYLVRARRRGWDWPAAWLSVAVMVVVDLANYRGYRAGERMRGRR